MTQEEYKALLQQILEASNLDESIVNVVEQLKNDYPEPVTTEEVNPFQAELDQALAEKEELKQKYIARFFGGSTGEETEPSEEEDVTEETVNIEDLDADGLDSEFTKLLYSESEEE